MAMVPLKGEIQPPARGEAMHQGETPVDVTAVVASAKAELWETLAEKSASPGSANSTGKDLSSRQVISSCNGSKKQAPWAPLWGSAWGEGGIRLSSLPAQSCASHAEMQLGSYPGLIVPKAKETKKKRREPLCSAT